jgi:hypothetical protein
VTETVYSFGDVVVPGHQVSSLPLKVVPNSIPHRILGLTLSSYGKPVEPYTRALKFLLGDPIANPTRLVWLSLLASSY